MGHIGRAHQVHLHHQLKIIEAHLRESLVTEDTGIVDDDVELTIGIDRLLDHGCRILAVGHGTGIGDGFAARCPDLLDDFLGRAFILAAAIPATAKIIHHDLRTPARQFQRMGAAKPAPRAGDQRDTTFKIDLFTHYSAPLIDLEQARGALAAADTHGHDNISGPPALALYKRVPDEPRA